VTAVKPAAAGRSATIALAFFFAGVASRELFRLLPDGWDTLAWKLSWVALSLGGLAVAHHMDPREALAELGLRVRPAPGLGFALIASIPMLLVLAATSKIHPPDSAGSLLAAALLAPLTEEIFFRGYLFRQLYRRARWSFSRAIIVSALFFGLAHMGTALRSSAWEVAGVTVVTGLGGAFFAWLLVCWDDNLWVPIGMHAFMNLWWELFDGDGTALGSWAANSSRGLAVAAAIAITLARERRKAAAARPSKRVLPEGEA
jgi:CAAX protease family protein